MESAPRNGTIIELVCIFGIAPWYMIARWDEERWQNARDPMRGVSGDDTLRWRPYAGDPASYVDPTSGQQDTRDYWQAAVFRAQHGIS